VFTAACDGVPIRFIKLTQALVFLPEAVLFKYFNTQVKRANHTYYPRVSPYYVINDMMIQRKGANCDSIMCCQGS